jgi:PAS domain S-box-containing protein
VVLKIIRRLISLALLLILFLLVYPPSSFPDHKQHVLFLNSYHQGYPWSDNVLEGIRSVLNKEKVDIHAEYMDTKRMQDDKHFQNLFELYLHKFPEKDFDLIISSDDNAFQFLLKNRSVLFPFAPMVFCGVNNFEDSMLTGHNDITGVAEDIDIKSTVDIALKLHPRTQKVYAISDQTKSGRINAEKFKKIIPDYKKSLQFILWDNLKAGELEKKLKELPQDSIVLFLHFSRDRSGKFFSIEEQLLLITANAKVPVYTCWTNRIQYGVMGGMVLSGFYQGEAAGKMALRILRGEKADNIPVLKKSPNRYMFDYKQLKRFKVLFVQLPEGSIVLNQPSPFFQVYKEIIWMVLSVLAILILSVFVLIVNITKRKKAEEFLRTSEEKYRNVVENIGIGVALINRNMEIITLNKKVKEWFPEIDVSKKPHCYKVFNKPPKEDICSYCPIAKTLEDGQVHEAITETPAGDKIINYRIISTPIKDKEGKVVAAIEMFEDISEKKRAEEKIKHSLEEKEVLLKEIHHRVKNNMQIISSILTLQSQFVSDEKMVDILRECMHRIKSMALIHDKLYRTTDFKNLNFKDYTTTLITELFDTYNKDDGKVELKLDISDTFLDIDTAIPLGLIINELLTNALKHAFTDGRDGEISVSFHETYNGNLELTVSDNGIGLKEGFDFRVMGSLGFQIITTLVDNQLKGDITLNRENGTEFMVTFKKEKRKRRGTNNA